MTSNAVKILLQTSAVRSLFGTPNLHFKEIVLLIYSFLHDQGQNRGMSLQGVQKGKVVQWSRWDEDIYTEPDLERAVCDEWAEHPNDDPDGPTDQGRWHFLHDTIIMIKYSPFRCHAYVAHIEHFLCRLSSEFQQTYMEQGSKKQQLSTMCVIWQGDGNRTLKVS